MQKPLSHAHIITLAGRGVLKLSGADRASFIQGLISQDIGLCAGGRMIYAAILTAQGKFLYDIFIQNRGDDFLIDCDGHCASAIIKHFTKYKLRAQIEIMDATNDFAVLASWPRVADGFLPDPRILDIGGRVIAQKNPAPVGTADFSDYDKHRIMLGIPDGAKDMASPAITLIEGNFDLLNGISWTKGCYIGQEVTARMHYRALVKNRLFPVKIKGAPPEYDAPIMQGDITVGSMRSNAGDVGLALLNCERAREAIKNNLPFTSGTSTIHPQRVEWMAGVIEK